MELEISSPKTVSSGSSPALTQTKKKRNLPGMPDPNAEVIALSPTTLLATNRFVCEICNKGFQRDQNLQLHRRGHNLPWKLKQRTNAEIRKKVYLCPEPSCIHHDPTRALGDLTGIKKHFSRKHGEKKWKCERCSKKYAVQADWKAHMKTCGSREYRCDCGTLFSRRDSFITHRAFCNALAEESSRAQTVIIPDNPPEKKPTSILVVSSPPPPPPLTPSATILSPIVSTHSPDLPENSTAVSQQTAMAAQQPSVITFSNKAPITTSATATITGGQSSSTVSNVISSTRVFASIFAPSTTSIPHPSQISPTSFSHQVSSISQPDHHGQSSTIPLSSTVEPTSLCLSSAPSLFLSNHGFSLFPTHDQDQLHFAPLSLQPAMSATALLQKATQMGVTASNASFLRGLGLTMSSQEPENTTHSQWNNNSRHVKLESNSTTALTDFGMGSASLYGTQPTTLDLLGLGLAPLNSPNIGIPALFTSFEDELELERNATLSLQNTRSVYAEKPRHNGGSLCLIAGNLRNCSAQPFNSISVSMESDSAEAILLQGGRLICIP